jgi:hypothetical protein
VRECTHERAWFISINYTEQTAVSVRELFLPETRLNFEEES